MNIQNLFILSLIFFLVPAFPISANNSTQSDKEFEIEAEKVEMNDTAETLKNAKAELVRQKKAEKDIEKQLAKAKADNVKFRKKVLPQIEAYKKLLIQTDQAQKRNIGHLDEIKKDTDILKEELKGLEDQVHQLQKEEQESKMRLDELRKDNLEWKKKKAELAKEIKIREQSLEETNKKIMQLHKEQAADSAPTPKKSKKKN